MNHANSAALYLRLSREDDLPGKPESESIASQRMQLLQYAAGQNISVCCEFVDDGISGTRRDRLGLQALLRSIEEGLVSVVLVKDLSRLSRDYILTGELLERWFPAHGVRLIAVDDGVDTAAHSSSNDFSPFRAVMDDWYARDISRKVRAAVRARQLSGCCTAPHPPYGYRKTDNQLELSEPEAAHVKMIFAWYAGGESCCAIAKKLSSQHIPPPSGKAARWSDVSVSRILHNTAYIGQLRLHTTEKISYKCSAKRMLPAADAIVFPIPKIISPELFYAVQRLAEKHSHAISRKHPLAGKLFCGECGAPMYLSREHFVCAGRKNGSACQNPSLHIEQLEAQLLEAFPVKQLYEVRAMLREIVVTRDEIATII